MIHALIAVAAAFDCRWLRLCRCLNRFDNRMVCFVSSNYLYVENHAVKILNIGMKWPISKSHWEILLWGVCVECVRECMFEYCVCMCTCSRNRTCVKDVKTFALDFQRLIENREQSSTDRTYKEFEWCVFTRATEKKQKENSKWMNSAWNASEARASQLFEIIIDNEPSKQLQYYFFLKRKEIKCFCFCKIVNRRNEANDAIAIQQDTAR